MRPQTHQAGLAPLPGAKRLFCSRPFLNEGAGEGDRSLPSARCLRGTVPSGDRAFGGPCLRGTVPRRHATSRRPTSRASLGIFAVDMGNQDIDHPPSRLFIGADVAENLYGFPPLAVIDGYLKDIAQSAPFQRVGYGFATRADASKVRSF